MSCTVGSACGCGFLNTGANYSETWDNIHKLIDKEVGCEECNLHGHDNMNGLRDHTKAGIGGTPYNIKNYKRFVSEVNCVYDKCVSDGRC